jgi:CcmD family protein
MNRQKSDSTMNSYEWIMYAGMAVWAGLGLYVCLLARRQTLLSRRVRRMSLLMEDEQ